MKTILFIAGTRPNFMKIAALTSAAAKFSDQIKSVLIHTGQHYDDELSQVFFREFNLPKPFVNLSVGSGNRAYVTQRIVERLDPHLDEIKPDIVVVVGDVTSSVAATLSSTRKGYPVAHVEAGLRSNNWRMPEEINRVMMDHLSSILFATEDSAMKNLKAEGIEMSRVHLVGNVMIDTLSRFEELAQRSDVLSKLSLQPYSYALCTMHRSENVDNKERLMELYGALCEINSFVPVILPLHPRCERRSIEFGINWHGPYAPTVIKAQSYLDFLKLQRCAQFVLTDSGGIQEEASMFSVPCLTIREETERPVTLTHGSNEIVGVSRENIVAAAKRAKAGNWKRRRAIIPHWDGKAGERIIKILLQKLKENAITRPKVVVGYKGGNWDLTKVINQSEHYETPIYHS